MKWREISDWFHLTLNVTSQKNHSIFFQGQAFSEGHLVALVDGLELAIVSISKPEDGEKFKILWGMTYPVASGFG